VNALEAALPRRGVSKFGPASIRLVARSPSQAEVLLLLKKLPLDPGLDPNQSHHKEPLPAQSDVPARSSSIPAGVCILRGHETAMHPVVFHALRTVLGNGLAVNRWLVCIQPSLQEGLHGMYAIQLARKHPSSP